MLLSYQYYIDSGKEKKLWITDGTKEAYSGSCMFFVRPNTNKPITMLNIHQVSIIGTQ